MATKIITVLILCMISPLYAKVDIAVIKGKYDKIDKVLDYYRINYKTIKYRELEDEKTFLKYNLIFFPCGMEPEPETSISVQARKSGIGSVKLSKKYYKADESLVAENIKNFIIDGGYGYFSGYAFKPLQKAFNLFTFFNDFPYMGMEGRVEARLSHDLKSFCLRDKMALYMTHPGWIALKSAHDGEVIAEGKFNTPKGERAGPLSIIFNRGDGKIIFTSYHSTMFSDFRRFNVFLLAGKDLIKAVEDKCYKWGEKIHTTVSDLITNRENVRTYKMSISKGENRIYFLSHDGFFQIDIFNDSMELIKSIDLFEKEQEIVFNSEKKGFCFVKVYPSSEKRFVKYAVISAGDNSFIPYWSVILKVLYVLMGIAGLYALYFFFGNRGYSGRLR